MARARDAFIRGMLALHSMVAVNVWKGVPFFTLLALAGLKAIDKELYEAASIDGANAWQRFLHITLPSLRVRIGHGDEADWDIYIGNSNEARPGRVAVALPVRVSNNLSGLSRRRAAALGTAEDPSSAHCPSCACTHAHCPHAPRAPTIYR